MHIVGTAGHVDHGKSTLIAALTGTHPDRLKEEIAREMTIDLGFAALELPNGEAVGIIDVPGHRDFISNMLAGIGGIDAALLVVSADEGVSAQTREHLAILDLLDVRHGILVLTKKDLAPDAAWLELVELEARELLAGTSLENAPGVAVSALTGEGIPELLELMQTVLAETEPKRDLGRPRLPVDRVFSMPGFGTVVTGTLLDGSLSLGEELVCLPGGASGRVRGLQNHKHKVQKIGPGFRTAVNLSGIERSAIKRGDVLCRPGEHRASRLLDVSFRLLPEAELSLKHNQELKLYIGAAERLVRGRILGAEELKPGQEAYLQLRLDEGVVAERGDRFILRRPSPSQTLGGGAVLDAHPQAMSKRFDEKNLERLAQLDEGSEGDLILQNLGQLFFASRADLIKKSGLPEATAQEAISGLIEEGAITLLKPESSRNREIIARNSDWQSLAAKVLEALEAFHQANPLRAAMPRENLRAQLGLNREQFDLSLDKLESEAALVQRGTGLALQGFSVQLSPAQMALVEPVLAEFEANPYSPPDRAALVLRLGEELSAGLAAAGLLTQVSDEILFSSKAYAQMQAWVEEEIQRTGTLTLAQFRDEFKTSRKYAAAFLEDLDRKGITVRKGDFRVLRIVQS